MTFPLGIIRNAEPSLYISRYSRRYISIYKSYVSLLADLTAPGNARFRKSSDLRADVLIAVLSSLFLYFFILRRRTGAI